LVLLLLLLAALPSVFFLLLFLLFLAPGVAIFNFSFAVRPMPLLLLPPHPFAILDSHSVRFTATSLRLTPATPPILHPPTRTTPPLPAPRSPLLFLHHQSCVSLHARFLFVLLACSSCVRQPTISPPTQFPRHPLFVAPVRYTPRFGSEFTFYVCPFFLFFLFCTVFLPRRETQHLPISPPTPPPEFSNHPSAFSSRKLVGNISFMIIYSSPEKCKTRITESALGFRFISSGFCFFQNIIYCLLCKGINYLNIFH